MLDKMLKKCLALEYENKILVWDHENFYTYYINLLNSNGFQTYIYDDVEEFRKYYEETVRHSEDIKIAIIVQKEIYVPFDVRQALYEVLLGFETIFPNLNKDILKLNKRDLDIISYAYVGLYEKLSEDSKTKGFLENKVFSKENVRKYYNYKKQEIMAEKREEYRYCDWMRLAKLKAQILYYAAKADCEEMFDPFPEIDQEFEIYINGDYSKLSSENSLDYPTILPKLMQNFVKKDSKTALIVMDGMSLFDFEILARSFDKIDMEEWESFALVPTVTSISRQSLMAGEYPIVLTDPFVLSREEKQFIEKGQDLGHRKTQIQYSRGYSVEVGPSIKLLGIIVNEVDDIMHGQHQGRIGMYNDIQQMAKGKQLAELIRKLYNQGFQILITSDHGNTVCNGVGSAGRSGVDTKTRSKRMIILKDYAELNQKVKKHLIEYNGYYMDKQYQYFVCKKGISFDSEGESVVTHGGITLEEVVVPFIKIKVVQ